MPDKSLYETILEKKIKILNKNEVEENDREFIFR